MKTILKRLHCEDTLWAPLLAVTLNILLLYIVSFICRVEFYLRNASLFPGVGNADDFMDIAMSATRFDTPGILYVNILYILLMLLPLHIKERRGYYMACKWIYVVFNSIAVISNLADSIYFPYTLRRTTWDVTREFSNESNIASIVLTEIWHNIWILILAVVLIFVLIKCYTSPMPRLRRKARGLDCAGSVASGQGAERKAGRYFLLRYYSVMTVSLLIAAAVCVGGIRGGWLNHWWYYLVALPVIYAGWRLRKRSRIAAVIAFAEGVLLLCLAPIGGWQHRDIRPIALSNANAYARHPSDVALILNTPFTLIRTLNDNPFPVPDYFSDPEEMESVYSPIHPADSVSKGVMNRKNVVVIILESFGEEYIDALNDRALGAGSPG
ncbi:MAG: hypothetical protein K2J15_06425, partial [Muribaculaceae bacterium]|nr:hypothetical protein [Muribaculaceae bacterium]